MKNDDNKKDMNGSNTVATIFPYDDIILKEIESWKEYAQCLRKNDRELFYQMISECFKHSKAIRVKGKEHSTVAVLMSITLEIYKKIQTIKDFEDSNQY